MMRKQLLWIGILTLMLAMVACRDTNDTANDAASAQSLQPSLAGFQVQNADNILDSFATAAGTGALTTGNVPLAATIERANTLIQCLQDAGAVSGNIYIQNTNVSIIPELGASMVINRTRVERNVLGCLAEQPFSAQSLALEPCTASGEFTYQNEQFFYAYVGAGEGICAAFDAHFRSLGATPSS